MRNLTLTPILILMLATPAFGVDFSGNIGRNFVDNPDGDAISQTSAVTNMEMDLFGPEHLWGDNMSITFESGVALLGFNDQESTPFMGQFTPSGWLNYQWRDVLFGAGYIHESDGEADTQSHSWNRYAIKADYEATYNGFEIEARLMAWNIADVGDNTAFIQEQRAFGDSEWGLEGRFFVKYQNDFIFDLEVRDNFARLTLGANPTDGENTLFPGITLADMDGQVLGSETTHERLVAGSVSAYF